MAEEVPPGPAEVAERMVWTVGSPRELRALPEHLQDGESVTLVAFGFHGVGRGLVALTNRRLVFLKMGWVSAQFEDFPINRISTVGWATGPRRGTIQVWIAGTGFELHNMDKLAATTIAEKVRSLISRS